MIKFLIYVLLTFVLTLSSTCYISAQSDQNTLDRTGFDAKLFFALNLSQLHGDGTRGFSLGGTRAGTLIDYNISSRKSLGLGLTYNQQGSNPSFTVFSSEDPMFLRLHYLSIPILFSIHSKTYGAGGNRTTLSVGTSVNRLFDVTTEHPVFEQFINDFEKFDISLRGGINYYFSHHSAISIHYEHAVTDILKGTSVNRLKGLRSFSFSVGYSYQL